MKNPQNKTAYLGLLTALAMILSYLETLIPPIFVSVPGIKMGLPNIVIVFALYCLGAKYAVLISLVRVVLVAMLFGNTMTLFYSMAGAILSLATMVVLKKTNCFSCVGVSVAGGVMHNLGQIIVAIVILKTIEVGYYMVALTVSGTIAGVLVGIISAYLTKRVERSN